MSDALDQLGLRHDEVALVAELPEAALHVVEGGVDPRVVVHELLHRFETTDALLQRRPEALVLEAVVVAEDLGEPTEPVVDRPRPIGPLGQRQVVDRVSSLAKSADIPRWRIVKSGCSFVSGGFDTAGHHDTAVQRQTVAMAGKVQQLWRFPVKSMQGESVGAFEIAERGVAGDRAWALVDASDGKVVSAKNPRKWKRVLELSASFVDEPSVAAPAPPVVVTLPDGTAVRSDVAADDAAGVVSRFLGRDVALTSDVPAAPKFEETWPAEVEGLGPEDLIVASRIEMDGDDSVSSLDLAMAAAGTFFDLARLHLLTTSTLAALQAAHPEGQDFDVRRYRANVVVDDAGEGFVENGWVGRSLALGDGGASMTVSIPTMRCVMTTMAQPGLARDVSLLQTIARVNRQTIFGGEWACAGIYGDVGGCGTVRVGDEVSVS